MFFLKDLIKYKDKQYSSVFSEAAARGILYKKAVLKKFVYRKASVLESLHSFSCQYCEIFKNTYFEKANGCFLVLKQCYLEFLKPHYLGYVYSTYLSTIFISGY